MLSGDRLIRNLGLLLLLITIGGLVMSLTPRREGAKDLFLRSLPDATYYAHEKEVFERYGRRLRSLVLVVPPLRFTRWEVRELLSYAKRMNDSLPFSLIWTLNGSHDERYVAMLASELSSSGVRVRVYADVPVDRLRPLVGVADVWARDGSGWRRLGGGGSDGGFGSGMWRCDEIYHGLMRIRGDVRWFYYDGGRPSGCTRSPPPATACDVHMIFDADFIGMGRGAALITFPGGEPAANCGGSCGSANTLVNGTCGLRPSQIGDLMFVSYMMTHTRSDPCPYYSYCGCLGACDTPQLFISDVRGVLRDRASFPSFHLLPSAPGPRVAGGLALDHPVPVRPAEVKDQRD